MNESIEITPAVFEDIDQFMAIETQSFSDPWSKKGFEDALSYDYSYMVTARCLGKVAGYCCLYYVLDEGEIVNVAVAPDFRGRGVGFSMLSSLIQYGREQGVSRFLLDVRVSNHPAIALYKKSGFKPLALQKNFYQNPSEDAWLMELITAVYSAEN